MKKTPLFFLTLLACSSLHAVDSPDKEQVILQFPTTNTALLRADLEHFYQPTVSNRAISGMYGFVRSSEPEPARYFNLFHEGIDIQPMARDAKGEPKDPVMAIAPGVVVYTNTQPGLSNYGRYVMIKHSYGSHDLYSTYGHLASIQVSEGQEVQTGQVIGKMGWSGNVGSRERAHVHLETGFLINKDYEGWYKKVGVGFETNPTPNEHGNFNGLNYSGVDPARLLLASASGKSLTIPQILSSLKPLFRVRIPAGQEYLDWQKRFPEQVEGGITEPPPLSWDVDCDRTGLPLRFKRSDQRCLQPDLLWFDESLGIQDSFNKGLIQKVKGKLSVSRHGMKWFSLLTWQP